MDYEQKYKEALERARIWKEKSGMPKNKQGILDDIFPELSETEHERIRKRIIALVNAHCQGMYKDEMLTWLEKQREQDYQTITDIATFIINYQGYLKDRAKWLDCLGVKFNLVEKQREQKSFNYEMPNDESKVAQSDSHDYVEIGGIKWATKNVGAKKITDSGLYFAWGDTQGYTAEQVPSEKAFTWHEYKYGKYNVIEYNKGMTKYNKTDGKTVLDSEDDAVTVAWGGNWRMPTHEEFQALVNATTSAWVENYLGSGVNGWFFTSNDDNSKTLFFPAAGYGGGVDVWDVGSDGYYWSRSLYTDGVGNARSLYFDDGGVYPNDNDNRYHGYPVRGVMK
jgi:hypothetical protein